MPDVSPIVQDVAETVKADFAVLMLIAVAAVLAVVFIILFVMVTHLPVRNNRMVVTLSQASIDALAVAISTLQPQGDATDKPTPIRETEESRLLTKRNP